MIKTVNKSGGIEPIPIGICIRVREDACPSRASTARCAEGHRVDARREAPPRRVRSVYPACWDRLIANRSMAAGQAAPPERKAISAYFGMLLLTLPLLNAAAAPPKATQSGVKKPAPPSLSNPVGAKTAKSSAKGAAKEVFYPVSSQQAADAILADSLGRVFEQGDEHFHKGEYNHVVNLNSIVMEGDPHNVETYSNSAWLLWSTDRGDQAITVLKQGIKANPDTYYMYDEMGTHYWIRLHDPVTALPYYEQAVKFKCPFLTWHNLAHCYTKTQQWDKAVHAWEQAMDYSDDKVAPVQLARARAERDKHKTE